MPALRSIALASTALVPILFGMRSADAEIGSRRTLEYSRDSMSDFFVSPKGSDSNDCRSLYSPCLTIEGAQTKLRAVLPKAGQNRPWTVEIAGGTYQLAGPLVFSAADSGGSERNRVTWKGAPGETPVISGGREITGWTAQADGTWVTGTIAELQTGVWNPRHFWADDQRRSRPRAPGLTTYFALAGYASVGGAPVNNTNQFVYSGADLSPLWANIPDTAIWVKQTWSAAVLQGTAIDGTAKTYTATGWSPHRYNSIASNAPFFVENVKEKLVEQPGTFYIDRTPGTLSYTGRIIYNPKQGESINTMRMVIPIADHLMSVSNTNDGTAAVQHITFDGLTFAHTDWRPPLFDRTESNLGVGLQSAISVAGATDIVFDRITVRNTGANGITLGAGCTNCKVINSTFGDIGGNAIESTTMVPSVNDLNGSYSVSEEFPENMVTNPSFSGINSTSPAGVNWVMTTSNGFTPTVTGAGVENGIPYVDVRFKGTNSSGSAQDFAVQSTLQPGRPMHIYDAAVFLKRVAGSMTGINYVGMTATVHKADSQLIGNLFGAKLRTAAPPTATAQLHASRLSDSQAVTDVNAAKVMPCLYANVVGGATVDVTIRFGLPVMTDGTHWRNAVASATGPQLITGTVISNNLVRNFGQTRLESAGIAVTEGTNVLISNNDIKYGFAPGIWLGWLRQGYTLDGAGNYTVEPTTTTANVSVWRNRISTLGQTVGSDFGGIHTGGNSPGTVIAENVIDDLHGHHSPSEGIYNDQGSSNMEVTRNTIVDTGGSCLFHNPGINIHYHNNICYDVAQKQPDHWFRGTLFALGNNSLGTIKNLQNEIDHNVVSWKLNNAPELPRLLGIVDNPITFAGFSRHDNIYYRGVDGPPTYVKNGTTETWTTWTTVRGYDAGSRWVDPQWTGTPPFLKPTVTPSGWVDWDQTKAGLNDKARALGFATPINPYSPLP